MKLYAVWCEWNIGLNMEGHNGCYSSKENLDEALKDIDLSDTGYNSIEEAIRDGLIVINIIDG